ncbi:hypothetical protein Ssi02_07010 [Sinosporangium siamense]|uniref:Uncharacterized protein n=1 Tax=Sinosporangium siamense TaxID=1367973 RepID=A0A919RCX6_9ACTN|nr:hypothetical protein Ssi02_07010 [Sinosporangium siamense]
MILKNSDRLAQVPGPTGAAGSLLSAAALGGLAESTLLPAVSEVTAAAVSYPLHVPNRSRLQASVSRS